MEPALRTTSLKNWLISKTLTLIKNTNNNNNNKWEQEGFDDKEGEKKKKEREARQMEGKDQGSIELRFRVWLEMVAEVWLWQIVETNVLSGANCQTVIRMLPQILATSHFYSVLIEALLGPERIVQHRGILAIPSALFWTHTPKDQRALSTGLCSLQWMTCHWHFPTLRTVPRHLTHL